jgi:hypothetical protein
MSEYLNRWWRTLADGRMTDPPLRARRMLAALGRAYAAEGETLTLMRWEGQGHQGPNTPARWVTRVTERQGERMAQEPEASIPAKWREGHVWSGRPLSVDTVLLVGQRGEPRIDPAVTIGAGWCSFTQPEQDRADAGTPWAERAARERNLPTRPALRYVGPPTMTLAECLAPRPSRPQYQPSNVECAPIVADSDPCHGRYSRCYC